LTIDRRGAWVLLLLASFACNRRQKVEVQPTIEEAAPALASSVHTRDPKSAGQLVSGFHQIEANAWRWTAKSFAVALYPPAGSGQKGATLQLKFTIPPVVTEKLGKVTLSASVAGSQLAPESYSRPGQYTYERDIPPGVLSGNSVRVDFQLDKALPPGETDLRELGVVVVSAGLESK